MCPETHFGQLFFLFFSFFRSEMCPGCVLGHISDNFSFSSFFRLQRCVLKCVLGHISDNFSSFFILLVQKCVLKCVLGHILDNFSFSSLSTREVCPRVVSGHKSDNFLISSSSASGMCPRVVSGHESDNFLILFFLSERNVSASCLGTRIGQHFILSLPGCLKAV